MVKDADDTTLLRIIDDWQVVLVMGAHQLERPIETGVRKNHSLAWVCFGVRVRSDHKACGQSTSFLSHRSIAEHGYRTMRVLDHLLCTGTY